MKQWITGGLAAAMLFSSLFSVPMEAYAEGPTEQRVSYSDETNRQLTSAEQEADQLADTESIKASTVENEAGAATPSPTPVAEVTPSPHAVALGGRNRGYASYTRPFAGRGGRGYGGNARPDSDAGTERLVW